MTVDGFPITNTIDFLPDKPDPDINQWSYGKTIKVEVWGDEWYEFLHNRFAKRVTWKGVTVWTKDYQWFMDLVKQSIENKFYPKTKEQALDEMFEMELWSYDYAKKNANYRRECQEWFDMQKPELLGLG